MLLHPKSPLTSSSTLSASRIALHFLTDLDIHLEELGYASIQADGFAFVQLAFSVVGGYTLLGARLGETRS